MATMRSRTQERIRNKLGIIPLSRAEDGIRRWRSDYLHELDNYMESKQYDDKTNWWEAESSEEFIEIRDRKPCVIFPLPRIHAERVNSKLFGLEVFPKFQIQDDQEAEELIAEMLRSVKFRSHIKEAGEIALAKGACFVSFRHQVDQIVIETHNPNHCYPEFDQSGELEFVKVLFVFKDETDIDEETKKPKEKWHRKDFSKFIDIEYDNPVYRPDVMPEFKVMDSVNHNLGFVQGVWLKTTHDPRKLEGKSIIHDIRDFTDSLCYNLSQSDRATEAVTDPQTVFSGMTNDELEDLIRSSRRAWALGREGTAQFLEPSGTGIQSANEQDIRLQKAADQITRAIHHDPDKIIGSAQSAVAMKVMHEPLIGLINEMRPLLEERLIFLVVKIFGLLVMLNRMGIPGPIKFTKKNYMPKNLDIVCRWGEIFPPTIADDQQKSSLLLQLANGNIISRRTALVEVVKAGIVEVKDIDKELSEINTQKQFNTYFGG